VRTASFKPVSELTKRSSEPFRSTRASDMESVDRRGQLNEQTTVCHQAAWASITQHVVQTGGKSSTCRTHSWATGPPPVYHPNGQ
jgi:hypothetical protein